MKTYLPRHTAPSTDEWDGIDPLDALEGEYDRRAARRDRRDRMAADVGRQNREYLKRGPKLPRRQALASKRMFGDRRDDLSGLIENRRLKGLPTIVTPNGGVVLLGS